MRILLISFLSIFSWSLFADDCFKNISGVFNHFPDSSISEDELVKNYTVVRKFSGKSGDSVLHVRDKQDNDKIVKIFMTPLDQLSFDSFLEIYFTCQNSNLPFYTIFKDISETSPLAHGVFFPKFFGAGTVKNVDPFNVSEPKINAQTGKVVDEKGLFPFMVTEYLDGVDLSDAAPKTLSNHFKLEQFSGDEIASMMYQIALAIDFAFKQNEFIHFDLHPGNIRILKNRIDVTTKDNIRINSPRMAIFDFGLSRGKQFDHKHETGFFSDIGGRSSTEALKDFVSGFGLKARSFFGGSDTIPEIAKTKSTNQDVRFVNQIFAGIWTVLQKMNYVDYPFPYCGPTMQDCLELPIFSKLKVSSKEAAN